MHDIDRTSVQPYSPGQSGEYEYDQEYEFEFSPIQASAGGSIGAGVFTEAQEMELAAELLGVTDEAELEQFLGGLFNKAVSFGRKAFKTAKRFADTRIGKQLTAFAKGAVRQALPALGQAAGAALMPYMGPAGPMVGSAAASLGASALGLELEGLSPEDQEFEVAKQLVRLVGDAAQRAADIAGSDADPMMAAKAAMVAAAKTHAPGLLRPVGARPSVRDHRSAPNAGPVRTGTWVRQGNGVVLIGL